MSERSKFPNLDPQVTIHHCTKESPMSIKGDQAVSLKQLWIHDDAEETEFSKVFDGDTVWMHCPNCNYNYSSYLGD